MANPRCPESSRSWFTSNLFLEGFSSFLCYLNDLFDAIICCLAVFAAFAAAFCCCLAHSRLAVHSSRRWLERLRLRSEVNRFPRGPGDFVPEQHSRLLRLGIEPETSRRLSTVHHIRCFYLVHMGDAVPLPG